MTQKQGNIREVNITGTTRKGVLRFVGVKSRDYDKKSPEYWPYYIVTPNAEIINLAWKDRKLKEIINKADISLPDGAGVMAAFRFLNMPNPKSRIKRFFVLIFQGIYVGIEVFLKKELYFKGMRLIKGREMFIDMVSLANKKGWRVFLLGGGQKIAEEAKEHLERSYKRVEIKAASGPVYNEDAKPLTKKGNKEERKVISDINKFRPHMLFVGLGAPKQEKWIDRNLKDLDIGGAMVVGGSFDYISGNTKLPPKWINDLSLEWLWRAFTKPGHLTRALNAAFIFPLEIFWYKLNKPL